MSTTATPDLKYQKQSDRSNVVFKSCSWLRQNVKLKMDVDEGSCCFGERCFFVNTEKSMRREQTEVHSLWKQHRGGDNKRISADAAGKQAVWAAPALRQQQQGLQIWLPALLTPRVNSTVGDKGRSVGDDWTGGNNYSFNTDIVAKKLWRATMVTTEFGCHWSFRVEATLLKHLGTWWWLCRTVML